METTWRKIWIAAGLITALAIVTMVLIPKSKQLTVEEFQRPTPYSFAYTLLRTGQLALKTTCNLFTNN